MIFRWFKTWYHFIYHIWWFIYHIWWFKMFSDLQTFTGNCQAPVPSWLQAVGKSKKSGLVTTVRWEHHGLNGQSMKNPWQMDVLMGTSTIDWFLYMKNLNHCPASLVFCMKRKNMVFRESPRQAWNEINPTESLFSGLYCKGHVNI